jgi:pimeloyl-ACP methyl ester carboxylesterase
VIRRAVAVAAVTLLAGCGLDLPRSATTTITTTTPSTPTTQPTTTGATHEPPVLRWRSCGDAQCALVQVPLDHDDPDGPTTPLAVLRVPARRPDERVGALFVNPGGPGASATALAAGLAPALPAEMRDRFDIVGFDPRGVGRSAGLSCRDGVEAMYEADPTIEDRADRQRLLRTSRAFVDECTAGHTALLAHAGTEDAAQDMDLLRRAMGDEQLSYLGYSYGTAIGQVYADLYPRHVRAMVLDGVVDLTRPGIAGAVAQARGFEQALHRFAVSCRQEGSCPIGPDPIGVIDQVTAAAERRPIPAADEDRPAGPGEVALGLAQALYSRSQWDRLAAAIDDARDGDGRGLVSLADDYLGVADFGTYFAVSCLDARWPDVDGVLAAAKRATRVSPHFGEALVDDYVRCSLWPVPPDPVPPPSPGEHLSPVLVVSTVGDPATPYESGVRVARHLAHGVLLTYEGDGHTITFGGSSCIDEKVVRYLVSLTPPPDGTRCPAR